MGSDRSENSIGRDTATEHKKQRMEFTPHTAGRHQTVTCDSVAEHMPQEIQKDLKCGSDVAVDLRKKIDTGTPGFKPKQTIAKSKRWIELLEKEEAEEELFELKLEQEGHDMEFTMHLKEWKARQNKTGISMTGVPQFFSNRS